MSCNGFYRIGKDKSKKVIYDKDGEIKMIITTYSGPLETVYFPCKEEGNGRNSDMRG